MAELTGGVAQPEPSVGDAFGWAARDREWIGKLLLMGLIGLIPIVGGLQLIGWMLAMLDNLRAGRYEVPPAGFRYATRGVWLWLAGVIYSAIFVFVFYGVLLVFVVVITALGHGSSDNGSNGNPLALIFFPLLFIWFGIIGLVSLGIWLFVPTIIEYTDRTGLGGAFNIPGFIRTIRLDPQHNFAAAGLTLVAYVISQLGAYLCWVGLIFTVPYALTVIAGVLRWYEVSLKPDAPPPSAPA
jgi:hypothetical protein